MELKEQAKLLGVDVTKFENDDDLKKAVDEAESKKKESESKNKTEREEYLDKEMKAAIKKRDEAKEEARLLKKKIDDLEEGRKGLPTTEELKALKEELVALKNHKETIDKETEEKELAKKTEIERQEILHKKELESIQRSIEAQMKDINDKLAEKDKILSAKEEKIKALRSTRLDADILTFASTGEMKAINPRQIVRLLKEDFEYDDNLDKYYFPVYNDKGKMVDELTVEEKVKAFLSDKENENLVKSNINTDGMNTKKSDDTKNTGNFGDYDPNDEKIKRAAEDRGLSVKDWIDILKMKDSRLSKKK